MKEFTRVGVRAEMDMAESIKKKTVSAIIIFQKIFYLLVSLRFMGFLDDMYKWDVGRAF
jgi:hypothetical protein